MWSFYKTRSFYKGFLIYQKLFFNVFAIIFLCFKEILELEAVLTTRSWNGIFNAGGTAESDE